MFVNGIRTLMGCSAAAASVAVAPALAQEDPCCGTGATQQVDCLSDGPINANCPISKDPVDPETPTLEYKGRTIGFCCPGCEEKFRAWDEQKKDDFVRVSMMQPAGEHADHEMAMNQPERTGDPYLLDTCPVSGEKLGEMGDPIVKVYDGREVRFCCEECIEDFEADPAAYWTKVDAQIITRQMPYYPLETCIISGEALEETEMGEPINFVYQNRLIRFCCKGCKTDFLEDPKTFMKKLDVAAIAKQREHYPLKTCPISGEELAASGEMGDMADMGDMGGPIEKVYGNRLVRFCCERCIAKFEKDPTAHIAALDKAWREVRVADAGAHEQDDEGQMEDEHSGHSHGGG